MDFWICILAGLIVSAPAGAAKGPTPEDYARVLFDIQPTRKNLLFILATSGATKDDLRAIARDLEGKERKIKLRLEKNEIFFNGRATGIVFRSYQPLKIKSGGHEWTYARDKSVSANFFELKTILAKKPAKRKTSLFRLLLEEANAQAWWEYAVDDAAWGAYNVAGVGAAFGAVSGIPGGPVGSTVGAVTFGAAGGVTGGFWCGAYGAVHGLISGDVRRSEIVDAILRNRPLFYCSEKEMTIKPQMEDLPLVKMTSEGKVTLIDRREMDVSNYVTDPQKKILTVMKANCNSPEVAKNIEALLSKKAGEVEDALAFVSTVKYPEDAGGVLKNPDVIKED